jgi:nucleoside-diphosphate-sugar epimerase
MRVLVTGGNGMLGGYILRELMNAGHSVTIYARHDARVEGANSVIGDVMDLDSLKRAMAGHEAVIHLAGFTGPGRAEPEKLVCTNVMGTVNVLESAREKGLMKVVFASSGAATGFSFQRHQIVPRYLPVDEDHPAEPEDEYGLSKVLAEITCKRYSVAFGIRTICLRVNHAWYVDREGASVAVGRGWAKGLSVEELWARRYRKCLLDADGEWPMPGPPPPRNLLWAVGDARDVAQAFRLAVENRELLHEVFAINGNDTCSLIPTAELIARYFPLVPLRAALDGFAALVSCEKAARLLGYKPRYSWRESDFRNWLDATIPNTSTASR